MIPVALIFDAITLADNLLRNHLGKPDGWKPTPEDWQKFRDDVDAATVEREKQLAQERLAASTAEETPSSEPPQAPPNGGS